MPSFCFLPKASPLWSDLKQLYAYRIDELSHKKLNECCKMFIGTHKYHNYTKEVEYKQASAMRYMMDVNCLDKSVMQDVEFIHFNIKGQSFLYNQIRNMVGMMVDIMRNGYDAGVLLNSFKANKYSMSLSPGEGLILQRVSYDKYNEIKKQKKMEVRIMDIHKDELEAFKKELIAEIANSEIINHSFSDWAKEIQS